MPNEMTKTGPKIATRTILGLLFLFPPFLFWLTVQDGSRGGVEWLVRIWRFLPASLFEIFILLLPLPAIILGILAVAGRNGAKPALDIVSGAIAIALGVLFEVVCVVTVFFPP